MPPAAKAKPTKPAAKATDDKSTEELLADAKAEAERITAEATQAAEKITADAKAEAEAIRGNASQVLTEAQEQAAGVLAGARDAVGEEESGETALYRVVIPGASYKLPGVPTSQRFALRGSIIELDDAEAGRLRELNAIVGEDEPDPVRPGLPGGENPFGGKEQVSQEEHAAKVAADLGK